MRNIIFLYSHPIQYFAPFSRAIEQSGSFNLTVCYCSRQGLEAVRDKEFGVPVQWDLPLLEGYRSVFLAAGRPAGRPAGGFWSLINPGMLKVLWRAPRSYVVVHGWGYFTHILAILAGRLLGHCVCLRGESPWSHERFYSAPKRRLRRLIFQYLLFPCIHYFLYIGKQNKAFYRHFGVPESRMIFTPYAVDNDRFQQEARTLSASKMQCRESLGIPANSRVVLFSGKLIPKKRPMDLLLAFEKSRTPDAWLVLLGEGSLRPEIERYCAEKGLKNVCITGFVNQSAIGRYYAAADIFVLCSGVGETWGLSTNEAMNFGLPVLLSDLTGCSTDLCEPGKNGYVFPTGDIDRLAGYLRQLLVAPENTLREMGGASRKIIDRYSYAAIIRQLQATFR